MWLIWNDDNESRMPDLGGEGLTLEEAKSMMREIDGLAVNDQFGHAAFNEVRRSFDLMT